MSRRAPRIRAALPATVQAVMGGEMVACRTRDLSEVGICLDTVAQFDTGTRLTISLMDPASGSVVEIAGEVVRVFHGTAPSLGVKLLSPPAEWAQLISNMANRSGLIEKQARRLRVLVVGDEYRQRGAMALYVTSGWDVLFAPDLDSVVDAMKLVSLDAVIAELDPTDERWRSIMAEVKKSQPRARRIVRGVIGNFVAVDAELLVHRFVEREAGLDALLDALTAAMPQGE
jgi:hypothetical protein